MAEISQNAARRIANSVTAVERLQYSSIAKTGNLPTTNYGSYLVKTPSGGIPARSGTTLGSASCTIQVIDKSTDGISDGESIDVLNLSDTAIGGTTYIKAVRTKTGDYIAESGGDSESIEKVSTRVDTYGTTAFSTSTNQTKQVVIGAIDYTDSTPWTTSGNRPAKAGAFHVSYNVDCTFNAISRYTLGETVVSGGAGPFELHLVESGDLRLRLYLYDTSGSYSSGLLLDEITVNCGWHILPDDGLVFTPTGPTSNFDSDWRKQVTLEKVFCLDQDAIDDLTGNQAVLYLEGYFTSQDGHTATCDVSTTYVCTYIDSQMGIPVTIPGIGGATP